MGYRLLAPRGGTLSIVMPPPEVPTAEGVPSRYTVSTYGTKVERIDSMSLRDCMIVIQYRKKKGVPEVPYLSGALPE